MFIRIGHLVINMDHVIAADLATPLEYDHDGDGAPVPRADGPTGVRLVLTASGRAGDVPTDFGGAEAEALRGYLAEGAYGVDSRGMGKATDRLADLTPGA